MLFKCFVFTGKGYFVCAILMSTLCRYSDEPPRVPPRGPLTNRKSNSSLLPLPPAVPAPNQKSGEDSWDIKENVTLQINKVTNVGLADHTKVCFMKL